MSSEEKRIGNWKNKGQMCCVVGCNNTSIKDQDCGKKRKYFSVPADPKRRQEWLDAIQIPRTRKKQVLKPSYRVCSDHFEDGKSLTTSIFV